MIANVGIFDLLAVVLPSHTHTIFPMHVHRMPVNTGPVSYTYAPSLI